MGVIELRSFSQEPEKERSGGGSCHVGFERLRGGGGLLVTQSAPRSLKKSAPVAAIADRLKTIAKVICAFTIVLRTMKISVHGSVT